jgi:NADH-quinone oxidoreductase subunit L
MIVNRISDMFFMIGILALFFCFQSVEFNAVFGLVPYFTDSFFVFGNIVVAPLSVIGLLLFLGAMGKSAQIGLHT